MSNLCGMVQTYLNSWLIVIHNVSLITMLFLLHIILPVWSRPEPWRAAARCCFLTVDRRLLVSSVPSYSASSQTTNWPEMQHCTMGHRDGPGSHLSTICSSLTSQVQTVGSPSMSSIISTATPGLSLPHLLIVLLIPLSLSARTHSSVLIESPAAGQLRCCCAWSCFTASPLDYWAFLEVCHLHWQVNSWLGCLLSGCFCSSDQLRGKFAH